MNSFNPLSSTTAPVSVFRRAEHTLAYVVLDLANLLAGDFSAEAICAAWHAVSSVVDLRPRDQVLVIVSPTLARTALFQLPTGRATVRIARGPIVDSVTSQVDLGFIAAHFDYLVLGSANGSLVPFALDAASRGVEVVQVASSSPTSRKLAAVCPTRTALAFAA
jgi:hypothetical protein